MRQRATWEAGGGVKTQRLVLRRGVWEGAPTTPRTEKAIAKRQAPCMVPVIFEFLVVGGPSAARFLFHDATGVATTWAGCYREARPTLLRSARKCGLSRTLSNEGRAGAERIGQISWRSVARSNAAKAAAVSPT